MVLKSQIKVLIDTYPFSVTSPTPLETLKKANCEIINPAATKKIKLNRDEIKKYIKDVDAVIAGTEKYDDEILREANKLKVISRVGVGIDNIDFKATNRKNIAVYTTPDAPSLAVAELTIGLIINCARQVLNADRKMRQKKWHRYIGLDLEDRVCGVIGIGRIGKNVVRLLQPFNMKILVNDIKPDYEFIKKYNVKLTDKSTIYKKSDIITLHIPLTRYTDNLINKKSLQKMKKRCIFINTSRGSIVNENDLFIHLKRNKEFYAALDVYEREPYYGDLRKLENIILTPHLGSCSEKSRSGMELTAVLNIINYFKHNSSHPHQSSRDRAGVAQQR
ncbi:MAG: phosphoglycerate dehydrogenase [Candidatus Hydrogenedentota bacterium]